MGSGISFAFDLKSFNRGDRERDVVANYANYGAHLVNAAEIYSKFHLFEPQTVGRGTTLLCPYNVVYVYDDLGEKHKALSYYNQALPLRRAVGDRGGEAVTLRNLALLERSKNNLLAALTHIEGAINIIEDLRTKIVSQDLRTSYFASVQDYYQLKIDLSRATAQKRPVNGIQCTSTPYQRTIAC